ncbi:MAG: hypothetical protein K0R29_1269 [Pseudobdellovibrio sp.]|jgi:hypothetical protein|nr:hypothetical protein [Pseudobdellovibrio sp.]
MAVKTTTLQLPSGRKYQLPGLGYRLTADSAVLKINSNFYALLAPYKERGSKAANPLYGYRLNADLSFSGSEPFFISDIEHVRSFLNISTPWGEGVLIADHGVDSVPFEGACPKLLVEKNGVLEDLSSKISVEPGFYFNATPLKSQENSFDDILLVAAPSEKARSNFLRIAGDSYKSCQQELPKEWVDYRTPFMTALDVSGLIAPGRHVILGACDQFANQPRNQVLTYVSGKWVFNEKIKLPGLQRAADWGTSYLTSGKINPGNPENYIVMANHNPGATDSLLQILSVDEHFNITEELAELPDPHGAKYYFHKVVFADIDGDGENELLASVRASLTWHPDLGEGLVAFKRMADGKWEAKPVLFRDPEPSSVDSIDLIMSQDQRTQHLVIKYYTHVYRVLDFPAP